MTTTLIPGAIVPRCTASPVGRLTPCSRPERTSDMNPKQIAATLALTLSASTFVAPPAGAHHVTRAQLEQMVADTFGPAAPHARRIVACESSWNHRARHVNRNGTVDYGLFQINSGGTMQSLGLTRAQALDPAANIAAAYRLYRARGWRPWVCSRGRR